MICKKIDFVDEELEEPISGYLIIGENEIIIVFNGYNKKGFKKFKNLEEIAQEIIHTKEMLNITEEMLDEEIKKNAEYEEIINKTFET